MIDSQDIVIQVKCCTFSSKKPRSFNLHL